MRPIYLRESHCRINYRVNVFRLTLKGGEAINPVVHEIQSTYRHAREEANYSILDIECLLKELADQGAIWMNQDIKDLTESESVLINHYLSLKREPQNYGLVQSPVILQKSPTELFKSNEQRFPNKTKNTSRSDVTCN
jgi:hypothetical protein